jgi:hypothetical protein
MAPVPAPLRCTKTSSTPEIPINRRIHGCPEFSTLSSIYILFSPSKQELIRDVHFLKTENRRLRNRLPDTIRTTPEERRELVKAARGISKETLRELVSIVSPATFLRWMNADKKARSKKKKAFSRKPGRPRTAEDIRALIVRIARATGWGLSRVRGEVRKLGYRLSRQTVKNILVENGIDPGPKRGKGTWDEFLKIHWHTLITDFRRAEYLYRATGHPGVRAPRPGIMGGGSALSGVPNF